MQKIMYKLLVLAILLSLITPISAMAHENQSALNDTAASLYPDYLEGLPAESSTPVLSPTDTFTITVLHTNDFHGQLQASGSNPGLARVAKVIRDVQTEVGTANTLLLDAGDEMQGSLLSNLWKGEPTIHAFNTVGYQAATFGNHEFDWGQQTLISRTTQAAYPYVAANLVVSDTGSCATAGWTSPAFARPWVTFTVGTDPNKAVVGVIGVANTETPYITIASATEGLCFKDPLESILQYYDVVKAQSDVVIALTHIGLKDGGYGYGFPVYGDQSLAQKLITAGKPVDLIVGGHSHTDIVDSKGNPTGIPAVITGTVDSKVVSTTVVQAYYNGRKVGRADIGIDRVSGSKNINWQSLAVSKTGDEDPNVKAAIDIYANDPEYQAKINQVIGYSKVDLLTNYNGDALMPELVNDSIYNDLNYDVLPENDVDMFFNNAGGIRASITSTVYPYTLTYGMLFTVLPFGNATVVGDMYGSQIMELLNQSATLFKGAIQPAGIRYKFYSYTDTTPGPQPFAWGAYDVEVYDKNTQLWGGIELDKKYRVGTNEFLAPAGQDGYVSFKYMTNISYWGDMLNGVNHWISQVYSTTESAYNGPKGDGLPDGRIQRDGDNLGGNIIPLYVLHHNDSHGNLQKGQYVGYTQLASLIKQERARNPQRSVLLTSGDNIQGDSMMYYYKSAALGYTSDGVSLPPTMTINPLIAAFNAMSYTAMTLGNHEFNFGRDIFTSSLQQANFPILQANLTDDGSYGLAKVPVQPSISTIVGGDIKVAVLGIGNHRVPNYELPSNIPGLTFTNPISKAQELAPGLKSANDVVVALTHIGFTTNPKSVEVDNNVDTFLAAQTDGIDVIVGGHSHTDPSKQTDSSGDYKYLPAFVGSPQNVPVLINQAYRYNSYLGEIVIGLLPKTGGGYEVVTRAGRYIKVDLDTTPVDDAIKAIVDPYSALLADYNNKPIGKTTKPIDTLKAYTEETNGANLQADASVYELQQHGITPDFHLSGAMSNRKVADGATVTNPVTLTVSSMFTLMPYENSLVVLNMNGPQLKAVLERAYRNYYYYKYVPGYGGYSYYTTCMLDINSIGKINYHDTPPPALPDGNNVLSLIINGQAVDFSNATKFYKVSTVNYLAAGSCNFNDNGVSLWPLNQIANDTQYYVRDAVIDYITAMGTVSPTIEGRLRFITNLVLMPLTFKAIAPAP